MSKPTHSSDLLNVKSNNKNKVVENLLKTTATTTTTEKDVPFPLPSNSLGSSDILSRVQAFLPQIKTANEKLEKEDLSNVNIENVDEDQQYIEMNLGLGVYDLKKEGEMTDESEDEEEELVNSSKPVIEMMDQQ